MSVVIVTLELCCFFCTSLPFNRQQYPEKFSLNVCSTQYSFGTAATENSLPFSFSCAFSSEQSSCAKNGKTPSSCISSQTVVSSRILVKNLLFPWFTYNSKICLQAVTLRFHVQKICSEIIGVKRILLHSSGVQDKFHALAYFSCVLLQHFHMLKVGLCSFS